MPSDPFRQIRKDEFSEVAGAAYLNVASLGPLPARARAELLEHVESRAAVHRLAESSFSMPPKRARAAAARLIGASPDDIALGGNTSFGINLAALGLRVPTGSTVLVPDREFPANVYPWMRRERFRMELVPSTPEGWPDEERILDRITAGDVSILALSSVQFIDGYRADLHSLGAACRDHGVFLVVDAIQSIGHVPLDVSTAPVDVVTAGGHKWLCGPFGTGLVYVREEVRERLDPAAVGWWSMRASRDIESVLDYSWELIPDASRYEVGTLPLHDIVGFAASLELIAESDPGRILPYVDALLDPLRHWLLDRPEVHLVSPLERERRSGILAFRTPDPPATYRALRAAGSVVSLREGSIRVAAHLYNLEEDVAVVLGALEHCARRGWA